MSGVIPNVNVNGTAAAASQPKIDPNDATFIEKMAVIVIVGTMAVMEAYKGNTEAAAAYAGMLATYFLSRQGV